MERSLKYSSDMRDSFVLLALLVGCRFELPEGADAATTRCDVTKPFGLPVLIDGVNTNMPEGGGWLSEDNLKFYFARHVAGDDNLYVAIRAQPVGAFTDVAPLDGVNTLNSEGFPSLTADGLTLILQAYSGSSFQIHIATRTSPASAFSAHSPLANINKGPTDGSPKISNDGLVLYFASDRDGTQDIFLSTRANTSNPFNGVPIAVSELNTPAYDGTPVLSQDKLEIFFASSRIHSVVDIFHATRVTPDASFEAPRLLEELSGTMSDEYPTWISSDRCELIFSSDREGGIGGGDIWMAMRPK